MGRGRSKFSLNEMEKIGTILHQYVKEGRMTVSDAAMSKILAEAGYPVNSKWVERLRKNLSISPLRKVYYDDEISAIHQGIKEFVLGDTDTPEAWQLSVSDAAMATILKERGFEVNTKFVERTRRSLGIKPLGKRGGARPGAGRPSQASKVIDPGYALVMANHYRDTYRLSDHQDPTGALSGLSGIDKHSPKFGFHTTDLETAQKRKVAKLARLAQNAGSRKTTIDTATADAVCSNVNDIERLFAEEVERSSSLYGRAGNQGGTNNIRTAQFYSSL